MDADSVRGCQDVVIGSLRARNSGHIPLNLAGCESIVGLFSRQVRLHPRKLAVQRAGSWLTYEGLDEFSRGIAGAIKREMKDRRGPIAVTIADYGNFAASVLGVLRAGGFYVPIDPAFPVSRNSLMLQAVKPRIILTERASQQCAEQLCSPGQRLVCVDELQDVSDEAVDECKPGDLAYVIFTSGSTGRPKGVMQTHQNVLQVVGRYTNSLCLDSEDRVSLLSSCSVTATVATLLSSLLNGASLCARSIAGTGLAELAEWIDAERLTIYDSAPSLFRHLMRSVSHERVFSTVQVVRLVSDTTYKSDWELFARHFPTNSVLVNSYGCSEMSTVTGFYMNATCPPRTETVVPIGYPLTGDVDVGIVSEDGSESWVSQNGDGSESLAHVGEIVLRSRYLSPGYWNESRMISAVFSSDETNTGIRTYRTGDIGSPSTGQGLVHLGRKDLQIKLSGFRVEIAEVEGCLRECPGVKEAAVVVLGGSHGECILIALVTTEMEGAVSGSGIRSYAQRRLPSHMVPSMAAVVERLPCTPNGKLDRAAMVELGESAWSVWRARTVDVPQTPTEKALGDIWKRVLGLEKIAVEEDFFELGGNSLLGMEVIAEVSERFAIQPGVLSIFQHPTVRAMAKLVESLLHGDPQGEFPSADEVEEGTIGP